MVKLEQKIRSLEIKLAQSLNDIKTMPLTSIPSIIYDDWKKVNFAAKPYLEALGDINHEGMYIQDPWTSIVAYFLGNARAWTGPVAKEVKAELNRRLKINKMNG